MSTLTEYLQLQTEWLEERRHPKTLNEMGVAVRAFVAWLGHDIDIDDLRPSHVDDFEAAEKTTRRRQLTSNLVSLLRLYDEKMFPPRSKALIANARHVSAVEAPPVPKEKPESFGEFARLFVSRRQLSKGYADVMQRRALAVERWMGKTAIAEVLTESTVNQFLASIEGAGSPWTVRKWRQDILTMWRAAADDDLVGYPIARRIRKVAVEHKPIECYTVDEARRLIAAASSLKGAYPNGVARRHYWPAIIRFAWESGLRRGDCWRFDTAMLRDDDSFRIIQHKTKRPVRRMLRPETIAAIKKIDSQLPFAWESCEWCFGVHFRQIMAKANVDRGTFRWLRRACGSHIEASNPGAGCKSLGNTEQVFRASYDAGLATEILMPPQL